MIKDIADRNVLLSALGELRPVLGDRFVAIELALIDQAMRTGRGQGLGGRVNIDDGVALPRTGFGLIGVAAP